MIDVQAIRKDFPIFERKIHDKPLVYLDNAATSQKPKAVIEAIRNYYENQNSNVHRGAHLLSQEATDLFEVTRSKLARFIGCENEREVIYTRGTTEAVNLVATAWGQKFLGPEDTVLVSRMEHHSNFVPWQSLARSRGCRFEVVELTPSFELDLSDLRSRLQGSRGRKILALTLMSNVLGTITPMKEISEIAKESGALVFVDAAQAVAHFPVKLDELGPIDFLTFSSHKMSGPTGMGVLWARETLLNEMDPYQYGGSMILKVGDDETLWNELPHKFEAGTPNVAGVVGFGAAVDYLEQIEMKKIQEYDEDLGCYAFEGLKSVEGLRIFGPEWNPATRGSVFSFTLEGVHPHDLATFLDQDGIAVRAGHHCAQPLIRKLDVAATTRASLYFYNTKDEVDFLADGLKRAKKYFTR